jgi:probable F420-dependent oxidoreductase
MKYGVYQFSTDYAIRIDDLARETEARGFESLFVPEHTHIPVSRSSPWPGGPNLPKEYWHTLDPFVTLTAAAAVTTRLKVGTGICLVIERDPITLAKEVASLDHFSGGRVLFGIGGGWNAEEMEHHGTDFGSRWKVLRERIAAMKEIWTKDEAEYHGKFVNFDKIWSFPKPVQKPHPPILMGGSGPHARQRAADFDGHWMPIVGRDSIDEGIADLRQRAEKAGRDPATVTVSLFGARPDEGKLAAWRDLGIHRALFNLPSAGRDEIG